MSELSELEDQLVTYKDLIERRKMAQRLSSNRDFRKLILDGFCRDDAARFVQNSGNPALDAEARADSLAMAQASGHLKRYLSMQIQMGAHAEHDIVALQEAIESARVESEDADA